MRVARCLLVFGFVGLLGACGDDDDSDTAATTSEVDDTTTSSVSAETTTTGESTTTEDTTDDTTDDDRPEGGPLCPTGTSSSADFDDSEGVYAAGIEAVSVDDRTIDFDVIQWLVGEDARAAYEAETGDPDGPPNDYMTVNASEQVRTAPVADDADVLLVRLQQDSEADVDPGTFDELAYTIETGTEASGIFWLTFADGTVTAICEQFVP